MFLLVAMKLILANTVYESLIDFLLFNFKWTLYQQLSQREEVWILIIQVIRLLLDTPVEGYFVWHKLTGMSLIGSKLLVLQQITNDNSEQVIPRLWVLLVDFQMQDIWISITYRHLFSSSHLVELCI